MTAFLYDLLFLLPLSFGAFSFALPRIFAEEAAREEGPSRLLWLIPLLASLCCLLFKHARAAWRGVLAGILISFILGAVLLQPAEERAAFAKSLLPYGQALLLVLLCFVLSELLQRIPKLRFIPAGLFVLLLPLFLVFRYRPPQAGVCMIFLYALLTMADLYQRFSAKQGDTEPAKHLVRVSPFLLIVFLLLSLIKAPEEPYQWTIVKRVASIVHGTVVMVGEQLFMGDRWGGDKPVIGFSDRGSVGGDLGSSGYTVMEITAQGTKDPVLYLGGKSFDSFDGGEWKKSGGYTHYAVGMDAVETVAAAIRDRGADKLNDMVRSVNLEISYKSLRTKSVFLLPKTLPMKAEQEENFVTEDGDRRFANRFGARGPYSLVAYRLNRREEGFGGLLKNPPSGELSREEWEEALKICGAAGREGFAYEDYLAAREELKTQYLPDEQLTPAVREWLDGVLAEGGSDYEKLKRIETELKSFRYTDKPGSTEAEDAAAFLEEFVLNKREGYCSHFATTFVLLARAEGIPARYVQGFRAPVGKEERNEISSSCAHAWPEAYLDGIGWIGFEPTPGYESGLSGWYTSAEREGAA
ncbi:MAG: transglutaminase-like domain-containing protein, partial [Lachnospiraceae bacterium]|nr:transglutaminase-like domain-containing protein [Lachnospiraceae bacterium]